MLEYSMDGNGFSPLFKSDGWLAARTGYQKGFNDFTAEIRMGRHLSSNEAFLLLGGGAVMLTAGKTDEITNFIAKPLSKDNIYLVEKGEWHCVLFDEEGIALIVENSDSKREDNFSVKLDESTLSEARVALAAARGV